MVRKYFFIILLLGIGIMSCRQNDELSSKNEITTTLDETTFRKNENENSAKKSDSSKVGDLIKRPDSLKSEIKDPPVETTHWRPGK